MEKVTNLASKYNILIFSKSTCCLCYAVQILFQELNAHAHVHELDQDPDGKEIEKALIRMGCSGPVPAVFVAGKLLGSTNEVMSLHLSGSLIPLLKPNQQSCSACLS
ncbi:monothiol glutaredoxin-S9-like [Andrographis paniculata]|uniref:monothiol glutaredoxin-S9-like n=1 Tax=Andrographis paniculata TaxID=175694 RepID=UPI0021E8BA6F|nr:monothiol glutaredoxin-S9-like [Andrographis paniculata]